MKGIQLSVKSASDREAQPSMPTSSLKEVRASYAGKWDDRSFVKQTGDYLSVNGILKAQEWTAGAPSAPQINTLSSKLIEIDETNCDGMLGDDGGPFEAEDDYWAKHQAGMMKAIGRHLKTVNKETALGKIDSGEFSGTKLSQANIQTVLTHDSGASFRRFKDLLERKDIKGLRDLLDIETEWGALVWRAWT